MLRRSTPTNTASFTRTLGHYANNTCCFYCVSLKTRATCARGKPSSGPERHFKFFSASRHSDANTFYIARESPRGRRGHRLRHQLPLIALIRGTVLNANNICLLGIHPYQRFIAVTLNAVQFVAVSPRLRGNNILPVQKHRRVKCPIRSRAETATVVFLDKLLFIDNVVSREWHPVSATKGLGQGFLNADVARPLLLCEKTI